MPITQMYLTATGITEFVAQEFVAQLLNRLNVKNTSLKPLTAKSVHGIQLEAIVSKLFRLPICHVQAT